MGLVAVAKEKRPSGKTPAGNEVTTIKTKARIAQTLAQIAALRGIKNQDVLDDYAKQFDDELSTLLARRQLELRNRPAE